MNRTSVLVFSFAFIAFLSCNKEELLQKNNYQFEDEALVSNASSTLSGLAQLGKTIYFDKLFSEPNLQSCASCHMPENGFVGLRNAPIGGIGQGFISGMAEGAFRGRFGGRISPSAAYASFSPNFGLASGEDQEFKGGLFWDGRATGLSGDGSPIAEQALKPLLSAVEHNNGSMLQVLGKIKASQHYLSLWQSAFGTNIINTSSETEIINNFRKVGEAIGAYESSNEVNQFSSKYDAFLKKQTDLTEQEKRGLTLFNSDAKCFRCHLSEGSGSRPPLFTDFKYYNLGLAKNPMNPIYLSNRNFIDLGLGGFLASQSINPIWKAAAEKNRGKFKTPTLRNVARNANRAFMHNGIFKTLEEVIDFYNTRDESKSRGKWGNPEINKNIQNGWMGNLNLSQRDTQDLIAFLKTLNDGWTSTSSSITIN